MKAFVCAFLNFGLLLGLHAQTASLSGEVRDDGNSPIPFASVMLLDTLSRSMVKGTAADEQGRFKLKNIHKGLYFLRASYVGRSSEPMALSISQDITIGALIIPQAFEALEGVTVTAQMPKVRRTVDRLVFQVANTVISQGSSWEILDQTPGIIVMDNELQVRNQAAVVYINDKKVQLDNTELRTLLENYQGTNIERVEVLNNPPARYDAEGGAVVNIVTSKNISLGYKGNVNTNYTQGVFPKYYFGTNHFYKTEKMDVSVNYGYAPQKTFQNTQGTVGFINTTGPFLTWDYGFDKTENTKTHSAGLSFDYDFNDQNQLNITANAQLTPTINGNNRQNTLVSSGGSVLDSTFTTLVDVVANTNNNSLEGTYTHHFQETANLRINTHHTRYNSERRQAVGSRYFAANGSPLRTFDFLTDQTQDVAITTAQADYTTLLEAFSLELGAKGSFIRSRSILDYFDRNSGSVLIQEQSDNFEYDENVYAAYTSMNKDWEKWSVKAGLRSEYTESVGTSIRLGSVNQLSYWELFPSVYILHTPSEKHSFAFDYSRKLQRPRYQDLNPFRTFINENNFIEGNPQLLPSFSHNFNLNYTLDQALFFDLYYRDNGAYISTLSFQDNANLILRDFTQNVLGSISYGLDFNYGTSITDQWYLYTYLSFFHEEETFLALESNERAFTNSINGVYADLTNYLTLSKNGNLKGELGLTYLSGFLAGSYISSSTTNLSLGIRQSLWKGRGVVSLRINDMLNRANARYSSKYLNQDNSYIAVPETQYIRFGFTYNFGNYSLGGNEREIEKIERERL